MIYGIIDKCPDTTEAATASYLAVQTQYTNCPCDIKNVSYISNYYYHSPWGPLAVATLKTVDSGFSWHTLVYLHISIKHVAVN